MRLYDPITVFQNCECGQQDLELHYFSVKFQGINHHCSESILTSQRDLHRDGEYSILIPSCVPRGKTFCLINKSKKKIKNSDTYLFSKTKINNLDNSNIFTDIKVRSPHTHNNIQENVQVLQRPWSFSFCICLCRPLGLMTQMWPEPQKCCFRDWLLEPQTAWQNLKQI